VKYAQASNVNVDLGVTSDTVTLLIEDDGIGIPEDAQNNLLSHGIRGMRQRVRALHGDSRSRAARRRHDDRGQRADGTRSTQSAEPALA
jgi:signal transduction histidine kinase